MTSSTVSSDSVTGQARWYLCSSGTPEEELLTWPTKYPKPNKNEDHDLERGDLLWLQEFREHLMDDKVPEHRDSHASSSHEVSSEPKPARSADLGKHSVYTHFLKDRNCEICQRTKITKGPVQKAHSRNRTSCRKFCDLITVDHKVLIGHPMDPVVSVQNKNFSGKTKELAKVHGAR